MRTLTRRRRLVPAKQSPQWSDAAILRQRYLDLATRYAALIASLPERDQAVADMVAGKVAQDVAGRAAQAAVQAGADAVAAFYLSAGAAKGYRRGLEEAARLTGGNGSNISVEFPGWPDWTAE